jgi:uncharacterized protein (DUF58 family)
MDADALRQRVRRLVFSSTSLARAFERGDFRSVFRGRGLEFDSLREYSPDDDSRLIDWSATARLRAPFVRTYREDRSLTVMLVVDVSGSMDQGSGEVSKLDEAVLVSSLVAYAAQLRGLPVGCLLFARGIAGSLAPRRGKAHALAVAQAAAAYAAEGGAGARGPASGGRSASDLALAIDTASRILKRRSLVLIVSDFRAESWERPLVELARRHDVVAVRVSDRSDSEAPAAGSFDATDPETGESSWLPLGSKRFRSAWRQEGAARRKACLEACARARVGVLEVDSSDDPALKLLGFFEHRRAR